MEYKFNFLEKTHKINLEKADDLFKVIINDKQKYIISDVEVESNLISFKADDKLYNIYCFSNKDKTYLSIDGENYILEKGKTSKAKTGKQQKGNSLIVTPQTPPIETKVS